MASSIQMVQTPNAPPPAGHYSQAVIHRGIVYVAGQLAVDPATRRPLPSTPGEETAVILRNLRAILEAAGSDMHHVLRTTAYVLDAGAWGEVNDAYAAAFGEHRPARTIVPVKSLRHGLSVEIDAIAVVPGDGR